MAAKETVKSTYVAAQHQHPVGSIQGAREMHRSGACSARSASSASAVPSARTYLRCKSAGAAVARAR
eukprot:350770-Chlamydomonas_euryale.AAC.3